MDSIKLIVGTSWGKSDVIDVNIQTILKFLEIAEVTFELFLHKLIFQNEYLES